MLGVLAIVVISLCAIRIYAILPRRVLRSPRPRPTKPCRLAIFLGSGGHTNEALRLIFALDFSRYSRRIYITSEGDGLSAQQAIALELAKASQSKTDKDTPSPYTILTIPRARRVHQSLITTPSTYLRSLWVAIYHVTVAPIMSSGDPRTLLADVLVLNGPGTCVSLCAAVYLNKFIGLPAPRLLYIESFARVRTLSLSGKLLHPFVDRFIVQWPQALQSRSSGECYGWLV